MAEQAIITDSEEWRDVPGWEGFYRVSSLGRVLSVARSYRAYRKGVMASIPIPERMLKTFLTVGYPSVALCGRGQQKTTYVHELVCAAWHGPRPMGSDVAHNDGCKTNCNPSNLRWASRAENMADKKVHGTQKRGDALWFTKISDDTVAKIRGDDTMTNKEWAALCGVSQSLISSIRSGRRRMKNGAL